MSAFTNFTGLAGIALAIAATAFCLPGMARLSQQLRLLLAGIVAFAVLLPFGDIPLAAYVRAATGDLSITTQVLLSLAVWHRLGKMQPAHTSERPALLFCIIGAALFLYPMALGYGMFDPYRLGYGSPWLLAALLALALAAWWREHLLIALTVALGVLAWSVGWMESPNLWDYLLDPLLAFYAAGALARHGMRALFGKRA